MAPEYVTADDGAAVRATAADLARTARARLVALLARPSRDIALAEDCVAAALEQALRRWPVTGVPDNPEGWLLTVARNRQRDAWRSGAVRRRAPMEAATQADADAVWQEIDPDEIPDAELGVLFACAHPALDPAVRTPLMLQVVLGVDAARIADAYAVSAAAMAKRLVRAKHRMRDAGVPFKVPDRGDLHDRLPPVLETIYGCTAVARSARGAHDDGLVAQARWLAETTATLLSDEAEAWSLAALTCYLDARAAGSVRTFVPLTDQRTDRWDTALIARGDGFLRRATTDGPPGRFQLEAAIHAVHCSRARTGQTDWDALQRLYEALVLVAPSLGATVARAAVVGRVQGPAEGLALLDDVGERAREFQPWHAVRADLLAGAGREAEAARAFAVAASLTRDGWVLAYLQQRLAALADARDPMA